MTNFTLDIRDPQGLLSNLPLLLPTIRAAVNYLDQFVVFQGTIDIAIQVTATSTGRFAGNGDYSYVRNSGAIEVYEPALATESRSGVDPHPAAADLTIYVDPTSDYLGRLWWDPQIATTLDQRPPLNKIDAFSVVMHELVHGMGIVGWRNRATGELNGNFESLWDSQLRIEGNRAWFDGAATRELLGQSLEVHTGSSQGMYHLGHGLDPSQSQMPFLEAANFNGWWYHNGERYLLGRLELAMLQDVGWTLKPTTLTDVVNLWDGEVNPRYLVGWDTDERLSGDGLADRIEGRGGNDTLAGGSGDDLLDGGAGIDTALYSGLRSHYTIKQTAGGMTVRDIDASEGSDTLVGIERLQFSDSTLNLEDFGAPSLVVARTLATVFGTQEAQATQYTNAALAQLKTGVSAETLMLQALETKLGPQLSNPQAVVDLLYANVIGTEPSTKEQAMLVSMLENGVYTPAELGVLVSELEQNQVNVDLIGVQQGLMI